MEASDFSDSLESLNSVIEEYSTLEQTMGRPAVVEPRLNVLPWWSILNTQDVQPSYIQDWLSF